MVTYKRGGKQGQSAVGSENVAGGDGRGKQAPKQKGSVEIKGFTTYRVPMTDHDYGSDAWSQNFSNGKLVHTRT